MKKLLLSAAAAILVASAANAQGEEAVKTGKYAPDWQSLSEWTCPEWFKDAKFGIWAHWGPQCQAEAGDWYARHMYYEGTDQYWWHVQHFGYPEEFGLKDLCNAWKADQWNPEELVKLYKSVGAQYFFTLGQHHDNFDLWNSPYQEWNSVNIGPKRDIVKEWSDACKKYGLPLGVSMHGSHAWTWLEMSQEYDGNLTKADGEGKWWEGYDPQELYAQRHDHSSGWENSGTIHSQWAWGAGASLPSEDYKKKFQNRVLQCINDYQPDMLYFDDTVLPFYGCDESVGLNILSHYYNSSAEKNGGEQSVVAMGKILDGMHKEAMLWDVERGVPDCIQEEYWQTCTCIGSWHYDQTVYDNNGYKSAQQVVDMLVDIVSKNGNLLLSIPVKGNGTIDDKEMKVLEGIKAWMDINSRSIYGTRPWVTFGEGPLAEASNPLTSQGFNEGNNYSSADVRYVQKGDTVYATILRWPSGKSFTFKTLGQTSKLYPGKVKSVELLGAGNVVCSYGIDGLTVSLPSEKPNEIAPVFAFTFDSNDMEVSYDDIISLYEARAAELRKQSSYDTGKLSRDLVNEFVAKVEDIRNNTPADEASQKKAVNDLNAAYEALLSDGKNLGGAPNKDYKSDLTVEKLVEATDFTRTSDSGSNRFGKPEYWQVDNFEIPNGGSGVKQGIDKYPGYETLMLGVWDDAQNATSGDLADARIYRTVHLDAGRYFFGANYETTYNINDEAYIFAANELCSTSELPESSIACWQVSKGGGGIYFTLAEEQDVILGFQANLLNGGTQQEFRAKEVMLYYYGKMSYDMLDELATSIDYAIFDIVEGGKVNNNTGGFSKASVQTLQDVLDAAMEISSSASYDEIEKAYNALNEAYSDFLTKGRNQGGTPIMTGCEDITVATLHESKDFARTEDTKDSGRFGAPLYWTVENYGFDNQAGIDADKGYDCLALEVWWNNNAYAEKGYDISNVRLYQIAELPAGRYYFGAAYPGFEPNDASYIFASDRILTTEEIPMEAIAFEKVNLAPTDRTFRGIYFTLEETKNVYLGFQADFSNSSTNNIRPSDVLLLYYGEISFEKLEEIIADVEEELPTFKISPNTGYYSQEAYDALIEALNAAKAVSANADDAAVSEALNALNDAYNDFKTNGKNKGGVATDIDDATDITVAKLTEASKFSRADDSGNDRFGSPKYWTVENILIDKGGEGIKHGLDKYPGNDCLMLGLWDDRDNNQEGDLANARIYQKIHLDAGRYFFGGMFNTIYSLYASYFFVSSELVPSSEIEQSTIAYYNMNQCAADKNHHGLFFTLDQEQDVYIGLQADLSGGSNTQEFRVSSIQLLQYGVADAITLTPADDPLNAAPELYTLSGVRLNTIPARGAYIVKQGSRIYKVIR